MSDTKSTTVKATREGLIGARTASGYIVDRFVPYVALPCTDALFRAVRVTNVGNGKTTVALVLDVGPWNEHDFEYVFNGARPLAERCADQFGRTTNRAGIDLGERVWNALGMQDNGDVTWEFV